MQTFILGGLILDLVFLLMDPYGSANSFLFFIYTLPTKDSNVQFSACVVQQSAFFTGSPPAFISADLCGD